MRYIGDGLGLPRKSILVDIQHDSGELWIMGLYPKRNVYDKVEAPNPVEVCKALYVAAHRTMQNYFNKKLQQVTGMSNRPRTRESADCIKLMR